MNKVLFISQWYPHRYDPMFGLFVRKHAAAVGKLCAVKVVYIHPTDKISTFEITEHQHNNITEIIIYYPAQNSTFINKISKSINYLIAYHKGFNYIKKINFKPDIIHANILTRTGLLALYYSKKLKIPYVITEHWSRYLPIRNTYSGFLRKQFTKLVIKHASAVFPVSKNLQQAMMSHKLLNDNYQVINNVVEDFFFGKFKHESHSKKKILHISCFDEKAKNIKGIISAIYELSKQRSDFELILVGTGTDFDKVYDYYKSLPLDIGLIRFIGELSPMEVAEQIKNCDFTLMFSNYENSPVVIAESLACGKPVLSTNVGGIPEMINKKNGILIEPRDEKSLTEKINYLLDHCDQYNAEWISLEAEKNYSYKAIGEKLTAEYQRILQQDSKK